MAQQTGRGPQRRGRGRRGGRRRDWRPEELEARRAALPRLSYPPELPVTARREDIAETIRDHQVVVIAGETGSGKTTQIPKICLELGRGITGMIGHTQPRRIAARTVAERIAHELDIPLGGAIGYQVRFTEKVGPTTLAKIMTDGILLAEIQHDPMLRRYDTLIIDEAHERSLNIDFILGYVARLLPRRPDLKVIITSATIDAERFAAHFSQRDDHGHPAEQAPVIEVSGRTYPVELRYRPLVPETDAPGASEGSASPGGDDVLEQAGSQSGDGPDLIAIDEQAPSDELDQPTAICRAVDELINEGPGDILVFLSGEREIRDADQALADHLGPRYLPAGQSTPQVPGAIEVLGLYARLSAAEQQRVFAAHHTRRVVLATNVAETSLTVPGIRFVIDTGRARISRYSTRTKVQRLPIEPVSQASANQRAGRCGRVADGVCIRLYSAADFASRPKFTEPEILRTSLASVILQMAALGLGEVADFPFLEPPDTRAIRDGLQLLHEIGAMERREGTQQLTRVGAQLAQLPIDPRLARMLLAGEQEGCAAEVMVIVAALSVQDVRERPSEQQEAADAMHRRFSDTTSDFLAYLNLWRYLRTQQRELSGSAFRRMCRREYLHYLRIREWQDVVAQLRRLAKPLGLRMRPLALPSSQQAAGDVATAVVELGHSRDTPSADAIHRSLLVGLLSNLGNYDERRRDYQGARGSRFVIWPGSGLARRSYDWVMAAELVETSRLFARTVARIDPAWVEPAAAHLVRKVHSEPYWSRRKGAAMVHEKVMLYGMTLIADRAVTLASLGTEEAQEQAREMFLSHALVEGDWRHRHQFLEDNDELLTEARQWEERSRRRDLVIDEDGIYAFYDERIPAEVLSAGHFEAWWKKQRRSDPELLAFTREMLLPGAGEVSESDFPTTWHQGEVELALTYEFSPGAASDGVTVHVPISVLGRLDPAGFDWLVPGLLEELVVATIRGLPKQTRVQLVPAPDVAREVLAMLPAWHEVAPAPFGAPSFAEAFSSVVAMVRDIEVPIEQVREARLPSHLQMNFNVVDDDGVSLGTSTSLPALQRRLAPQAEEAVTSAVKGAVAQAMADAEGHTQRPVHEATGQEPGAASGTALEQHDLRSWPALADDTIPQRVSSTGPAGLTVTGYPALVATGEGAAAGVDLRVLPDARQQARGHRRGIVQLLLIELALPTQRVSSTWTSRQALLLAAAPASSTEALVTDAQLAAVQGLVAQWLTDHELPVTTESYLELRDWLRQRLEERVQAVIDTVIDTLEAIREVEASIREQSSPALLATLTDVRAQLDGLLYPGFLATTPPHWLEHLPRYLRAASRRVQRAADNVHADANHARVVNELSRELTSAREAAERRGDEERVAELGEVGWLLEELRVSLFAQQLGTAVKVSETRIRKLLAPA